MRVIRVSLLTLSSTPLLNPFVTINRACLNSTVHTDLTAGNHLTNDARRPRSGAWYMGANEY